MYVNFLSTYSDKKSCHTATTLQTSIARFVSDSWASCWKCADAGHQKLSKLVHACRNYSLPKLARFLCRMTNAHPSWSLKLGTHWRVTTNLTESTFDFVELSPFCRGRHCRQIWTCSTRSNVERPFDFVASVYRALRPSQLGDWSSIWSIGLAWVVT